MMFNPVVTVATMTSGAKSGLLAVIVALPLEPVTARTWIVVWKVPAGIVTVGVSTWMIAGLLLTTVIGAPPVGAWSGLIDTRTVSVVPRFALTAAGRSMRWSVTEMLRVLVTKPFPEPSALTTVKPVPEPPVSWKVPMVCPSGIVMLAGETVAILVLSTERLKTAPPTGAAWSRVIEAVTARLIPTRGLTRVKLRN